MSAETYAILDASDTAFTEAREHLFTAADIELTDHRRALALAAARNILAKLVSQIAAVEKATVEKAP